MNVHLKKFFLGFILFLQTKFFKLRDSYFKLKFILNPTFLLSLITFILKNQIEESVSESVCAYV